MGQVEPSFTSLLHRTSQLASCGLEEKTVCKLRSPHTFSSSQIQKRHSKALVSFEASPGDPCSQMYNIVVNPEQL